MEIKEKMRDVRMDVIRCVAVFFVVCVHFFQNSEFYAEPVIGTKMFIMVGMRTLFMTCVPLFMVLSGYLLGNRDYVVSKKYYTRILKVIVPYIIITCFIYWALKKREGAAFSIGGLILNILGYQQYSWYVNTYIGLFLLIPFINKIWWNLQSKREERAFILTLVVLTILPSLANIFDLGAEGFRLKFLTPAGCNTLVPDWWSEIYPLTYYFVGAYLRKYLSDRKGQAFRALALLVVCLFCFTYYNFARSNGNAFAWGPWCHWNGFENFIDTVLLFVFLKSIPFEKMPRICALAIRKVSMLSFGIYIGSYVVDELAYNRLIASVPVMTDRIWYFLPTVLVVFFASMAISFFADLLYRAGGRAVAWIVHICREKR